MKTELVELAQPKETIENVNKVSPKQWKEWDERSHRLFNWLYGEMKLNQSLFTHPQAAKIPAAHWTTICWNAAWEAADGPPE